MLVPLSFNSNCLRPDNMEQNLNQSSVANATSEETSVTSNQTNTSQMVDVEDSLQNVWSGDSGMEEGTLRLTDLPAEILIHIASFLDSRLIISSLCQVCLVFRNLFSGDIYWKTRISQRWPKKYPLIEREDFNWREGCMEREEKHRTWLNPETTTNHFVFRDGFFAAVDVVHFMKGGKILATGSRDRYINILDLNKYDPDRPESRKDCLMFSNGKIHKGWVWSMASHDGILATGSWDTYVRLWDFGEGEPRVQTDFKCKSALLGLHLEPRFVAAGGYDKRLYMFDPRDPNSLILKRYHSQPILSVVADDRYVITGSEDSVISVYDRCAGKNFKKIEVESFVMDMSYGDGELWFGDKQGKLHVMDTADGLFDNIQSLDVGHEGKLSGVCHTKGAIFTCGTDGLIKVVEPSHDPGIISNIKTHSAPVARVSVGMFTAQTNGGFIILRHESGDREYRNRLHPSIRPSQSVCPKSSTVLNRFFSNFAACYVKMIHVIGVIALRKLLTVIHLVDTTPRFSRGFFPFLWNMLVSHVKMIHAKGHVPQTIT